MFTTEETKSVAGSDNFHTQPQVHMDHLYGGEDITGFSYRDNWPEISEQGQVDYDSQYLELEDFSTRENSNLSDPV